MNNLDPYNHQIKLSFTIIANQDLVNFFENNFTDLSKLIQPNQFKDSKGNLYNENDPIELLALAKYYLKKDKDWIFIYGRRGHRFRINKEDNEIYGITAIIDYDDSKFETISNFFVNEIDHNYLGISYATSNFSIDGGNIGVPTSTKLEKDSIRNLFELMGDQLDWFKIFDPNQITIDPEILLTAPAFKTKKLNNGSIYMLLTETFDPTSFDQNFYDTYRAVYEHIKTYVDQDN